MTADKKFDEKYRDPAFSALVKKDPSYAGTLGEKIGSGTFGTVYRLTGAKKGKVMKVISSAYNCDEKRVVKDPLVRQKCCSYSLGEIGIMQKASCDHLMPLCDHFVFPIDQAHHDNVYILVMPEMIPADEWFARKTYSRKLLEQYVNDICEALTYCHETLKILHRDVKPQNSFYDPVHKRFVLGDFGASRVNDTNDPVTVIGSFVAPEIGCKQSLHGRFNSDLYSLSWTLLQIISVGCSNAAETTRRFDALPQREQSAINDLCIIDPAGRTQTVREFKNAFFGLSGAAKTGPYAGRSIPTIGPAAPRPFTNGKACRDAFKQGKTAEALKLASELRFSGKTEDLCLYAFVGFSVDPSGSKEYMNTLSAPAKQGNASAQFLYSLIGLRTDPAGAKDYRAMLRKSADKGHVGARYVAGRFLHDGEYGFPVDKASGLSYILKATDEGFMPAIRYFDKIHTANRNNEFRFDPVMSRLLHNQLAGYSTGDICKDMIDII